MIELAKLLAPYGLVLAGLIGAGLNLPDVAWGGCLMAGLGLINPAFKGEPKLPQQ